MAQSLAWHVRRARAGSAKMASYPNVKFPHGFLRIKSMEGNLCGGDRNLRQAQKDAHLLNELAGEDGLAGTNFILGRASTRRRHCGVGGGAWRRESESGGAANLGLRMTFVTASNGFFEKPRLVPTIASRLARGERIRAEEPHRTSTRRVCAQIAPQWLPTTRERCRALTELSEPLVDARALARHQSAHHHSHRARARAAMLPTAARAMHTHAVECRRVCNGSRAIGAWPAWSLEEAVAGGALTTVGYV